MTEADTDWREMDREIAPERVRDAIEQLRADGHRYVTGWDVVDRLPEVQSVKELTAHFGIAREKGWWERWSNSGSGGSTYRITVEDSDEQ